MKACSTTVIVDSLACTEALAQDLAPLLRAQDVVLLSGDLGAGKTAFSRALIRTLTSPDEPVPSPTFTLVQLYPTLHEEMIWHFDLYRIKDSSEVWELGIEEAFSDAISVIEWPERLPNISLNKALRLNFLMEKSEDARRIDFIGTPYWSSRLAKLSEMWRLQGLVRQEQEPNFHSLKNDQKV